jgi:ligand-binding SRPBCC domain-containing protein
MTARGEHLLALDTVVPKPRRDVFAFFADAANLERITPPELRFRILTPLPIAMRAGTLIDYHLRLFGVPFRWTTRISMWEPDTRFVDEQLAGPYALWHHTHEFRDTDGGTLVSDRVRYRLPLYPAGEVALPIVRAQLRRIFSYRTRRIAELLGATVGDRASSHPLG